MKYLILCIVSIAIAVCLIACYYRWSSVSPNTFDEDLHEAKMLKKIKQQIDSFVSYLHSTFPSDPRCRLLQERYKNTIIERSNEAETYTLNKGERMRVCMKNYKNGSLHDDQNLIMFVCLHELAHIMTISNHHTDEFWQNFEFILREAASFGIYIPIDYKYDPVWYCAMLVYDNPYFNERTPQQHAAILRKIITS